MKMVNNKNLFNYYFNEEGEEQVQQDPNAEGAPQDGSQEDPNAQQQDSNNPQENSAPQQPAILPDDNSEDEDDEFEKEFPMEKDGQDPQQDILNFTNFQKINYFNRFKQLIKLTEKVEKQIKESKTVIELDDIDDEKQDNVITVLLTSLNDIQKQIKFFLEKGIAAVNIDKTRCIFRAEIRKINYIIDKFEHITKQSENKK